MPQLFTFSGACSWSGARCLFHTSQFKRETTTLHTQGFEHRCAPGAGFQRVAAAHLTACYAGHLSEASSTSCPQTGPQTAGHERQPGEPASSCSKQHHVAELRPAASTADKLQLSQLDAVQRPLPSERNNSPNKYPKNGWSTPQADRLGEFLKCCIVSSMCATIRTHNLHPTLQTSMSGISVTEDAVNLYYYLKAKSVVSVTSRYFLIVTHDACCLADLMRATCSTGGQLGGSMTLAIRYADNML